MAILSWLGLGLLATPLTLFKLNPYSYQQISFNRGSYEGHQRPVISPDLEAYIQQTLTKSNVPGLSLAIVRTDGDPEFRSWGNMTDDGEKTTPETLFHLASVSKAFVASSLGILIDDFANGRNTSALPPGLSEFTWKTKLRDILPGEWELMDEWASEKANVHDILSHVTGMPRHDYSYGPNDTPIDVVRRLKHLRPAYELREKFSYNNQMFLVGAHIVSTYAKPYTQFVEERIFSPLGMTSTTFSPSQAAASGKLTQAWTKHGRLLPEWFNEDIAQLNAGPGAVISSTSDMSKWIHMWLNSGTYMNKTIIPLSAFENITTAYSITFGKPENAKHSIGGYGMGWFRSSFQGHDVFYHTGSIPGFSTRVSVVQPSASQNGLGVIVFANADDKAETVADISDRVMEDAFHIRGFSEAFDSHASASNTPNYTYKGPLADIARTNLSIDDYSGTYTNPGYGAFTLCGPSSTSSYCEGVLSEFAFVDAHSDNTVDVPQLVAAWPRIWSSHLRMRYLKDSTFVVFFTALFPNGYGTDTTPFETADSDTFQTSAEFVVQDGEVVGFGLFGLVGEITERERQENTIQDKAEAWFVKV